MRFDLQNGSLYRVVSRAIKEAGHSLFIVVFIGSSLKDKYNYTPLKLAIDEEHAECEKILREHGAREE